MNEIGASLGAITAVGAALAVMLACTALGSTVGGGRDRVPGTDTVVGLGLAGGILSVLAAATRLPISFWASLLGMAGIFALAWSGWHRRLPGGPGFAVGLLVASPLVVFAALGPATMSDDFAQWLRNAAYVFQYDSLPRSDLPPSLSRWPGYPHILPFIVTISSWLTGRFLETAGPVANVVLLVSAGAAIGDVAAGERRALPVRLAVAAATVGAFFVLFFPELTRNVLFSSYADTATIATVGILGLLGVSLLERLAESRDADAQALAWRFGLAAAALVNLKQANLVLLALLLLGLLLAGWRTGWLGWARALRLLPSMALPAALVFLVWRHYVKNNVPSGEMAFRPPSLWNWSSVPDMVRMLGVELALNPAFHLLMWAVTLAGLWKLRTPRRPGELLAVTTAVVWIGYNAFLIIVYLAVMYDWEAVMAADYWRYTPHVGMLAVAAVLIWLRQLPWPQAIRRLSQPLLLALAVLLPLTLLVAGPQRFSALGKVWPVQFRTVGREVSDMLPPNSRLAASVEFDYSLTYSGIDFDLHRFGRDDRGLRFWNWNGRPVGMAPFLSGEATHLLVMDHLGNRDKDTNLLGLPAVVNESALFEWTGSGWRKLHAWPFPRAATALGF